MKQWTKFTAIAAASLMAASVAQAREPGVLPPQAPGATMGVPIAAPLPDGFFFSSRTGYSVLEFRDSDGKKTGTDIGVLDTAAVLSYAPGITLFGGQYRMTLAAPVIAIDLDDVPTPDGLTNAGSSGLGSIDIRPIDISWETAPGIFVNAGLSILSPGEWDGNALANPGQNFWSLAPSIGFSYLRDGWNASANLIYVTNQRNDKNDYKSGDEINLHLTAMKEVSKGLSIGPVAYWRKQVTDDDNGGTAYGGTTSEPVEAAGLGLSATKQFGSVFMNVMYSRDVMASDAGGGERFWLNLSMPLSN